MKPYPNEELERMSKREIIRLYKRTVEQFNDAVPVIRCKDCKYSSPNQVYGCRIHSFGDDLDKRLYSDDFCSRAERKEE